MDVFVEWTNRNKVRCRIRFDVDTNMGAANKMHRQLWQDSTIGCKLQILDSAFDRLQHKRERGAVSKSVFGSKIYIDTTITMPEIIYAVKIYMRDIYHAEENSLTVSVNL